MGYCTLWITSYADIGPNSPPDQSRPVKNRQQVANPDNATNGDAARIAVPASG